MTLTVDLHLALRLGIARITPFDATRRRLIAPAIGGGELGLLVADRLISELFAGRWRADLLLSARPTGCPATHIRLRASATRLGP